jgi:DNA primase
MISPETIALVKERTDIVSLIGETVRLVRRGRSFTGLCPFHKEKSPSFHVNPERGFFHCFGCKESGGAVDFVMKIEGRTFPEAVRLLAERTGIEIAETQNDDERKEANAARRAKDDLYAVNALAATFFERSLRGAPHALASYARDELARRGLALPDQDDAVGEAARIPDTLQAFRIGYAPWGWDGLATFFRQQGISPLAGEKVGLLVPRSSGSGHYDRFRHRLMFAVIDVMGRVIAFSGRALADPMPAEIASLGLSGPTAAPDGPPAKYINSPESPIYTKGEHLFGLHQARQAIRTEGEAILVEGNFDVVALHARGINNVVAPLGTAFTPAQARLLKRFAPNVTLLFDGDAAGKKATRAARAPCREGGLSAKVGSLPDGIDPDDFVRKNGKEGLERLLKSAREIREYMMEALLGDDDFGGASASEQLDRVRAVGKLLGEEDDATLRQMLKMYADRLSQKLVVRGQALPSLRELEQALERSLSSPNKQQVRPPSQVALPHDQARSRSQYEEIAQAIVGALLDFPELLDDPEAAEAATILDGDSALALGALRQAQTAQAERANAGPLGSEHDGSAMSNKGIYADVFLAQIPRSIQAFAVGRLASPLFDLVGDARFELLGNARKLRRLSLSRENAAGMDRLNRVQAQGDVDSENALMLEAVRRAQERERLR